MINCQGCSAHYILPDPSMDSSIAKLINLCYHFLVTEMCVCVCVFKILT